MWYRPLLLLLALLFLISCAAERAPEPEVASAPQADCEIVPDPSPGQAWELFLCLNQPVAQPGSKRWETDFRQTSTIFLPTGEKPPAWGEAQDPCEFPPGEVGHNLDTAIQADGQVLLDIWDVDVRYQLLMDQTAFEYILQRGFYNVNGQEQAARDGKPADFPLESSELKTSWIWLGTDQSKYDQVKDSYYIVNACFQQFNTAGQPVGWENGLAALTGMHISIKNRPDWLWITFENVHNPQFTQVTLKLPIPDDVKQANEEYQARLREDGSVFANYQLDGTQIHFTEGNDPSTAILLANSQIESKFQTQSSCITCHYLASITPEGEYFNMVDDRGGDVSYYVGDPPDVKGQGYTSLDFVWSMKRASRLQQTGSAR